MSSFNRFDLINYSLAAKTGRKKKWTNASSTNRNLISIPVCTCKEKQRWRRERKNKLNSSRLGIGKRFSMVINEDRWASWVSKKFWESLKRRQWKVFQNESFKAQRTERVHSPVSRRFECKRRSVAILTISKGVQMFDCEQNRRWAVKTRRGLIEENVFQ